MLLRLENTHTSFCLLCGLLIMNNAARTSVDTVHKCRPVLCVNKGSKSSLFLSDRDREPLHPRTFKTGHCAISFICIDLFEQISIKIADICLSLLIFDRYHFLKVFSDLSLNYVRKCCQHDVVLCETLSRILPFFFSS